MNVFPKNGGSLIQAVKAVCHRKCDMNKQEARGPHRSPVINTSEEEIHFVNASRCFIIIVLWKRAEFHSPKGALYQVWLKSTHRFWRSRFSNNVNVSLLFRNFLPRKKGLALNLNSLYMMLCAKFVETETYFEWRFNHKWTLK